MTYSSTVIADSPWGYWKCDETSGTTLADSSGNSRSMTTHGSPTLAQLGPDSVNNDAIAWSDSSGGTEYYADTSATFGTSPATFEAWVYLTALPSNQTPIVALGTAYGTGGNDKYLYIGTDGKVRWYLFNGGQITVASSNALSLNSWHHIIASVGAAGAKIRTDKTTDGTNATTGSTNTAVKVFIHGGGNDGTGGNTIVGTNGSAVTIAEVSIYTSQLSDATTDAHFDAMPQVRAASGTGSLTLSGTGTVSTYSTEVLADSPYFWYRMDDTSGTTMADTSGNSHPGTYTASPTLAACSVLPDARGNPAVTFNGSTQYGTGVATSGGSMTIEFWARSSSTGGYLGGAWGSISTDRRFLFVWSGGTVLVSHRISGTQRDLTAPLSYAHDGSIHHFVATYDGTTQRLYVDGAEVINATNTGTLQATSEPVYVARIGGDGSSFFNGTIDEVAYYTTAISAARVAAHYRAGFARPYPVAVLADVPLAYWRLDEASGTSALDVTGQQRTGTYNNTPTLAVAGALGSEDDAAATFASASSEDMTAAFWSGLNITTFTLECWVKTTGNNQAIMGRQGSTSEPYSMFVDASGKLQLVIKTSGTSGTNYSGTVTINDGSWHHVAIVRDAATSNTAYFYVDGVLDTSIASTVTPNTGRSDGFVVASRGGSPYLNGSVDEPAIFGTALSAARIAAHYTAGLARTATGTGSLSLSGSTTGVTGAYQAVVLSDNPIVYLEMDETSGTTATDFSGAGHNMTSANCTLAQPAVFPAGTYSYDFNGTSSQVSLADAAWQRPAAFTVEAWIKMDTLTNFLAIAGKDAAGAGWAFYVENSTGKLNGFVPGGGNSHLGSTTLSTGTTYHVAMTYDSGSLKLYLNGSLDATYSTTITGTTNSDLLVGVATGSNGGASRFFWFDGKIDGFAMYASALSGARLAAHYAAGMTSISSGAGSITLTATGTTNQPATGTGSISLSGSGTGAGIQPATGTGSITLGATGTGLAPVAASGTGSLTLAGSGAARAPITASGSITLGGVFNVPLFIPPHNLTLSAPSPTLAASAALPPALLSLSAPAPLVTGSVTITTSWTFYDPVENETYVFPINPDSEANPLAPKGLAFARGRRAGDRHTTIRKAPTPMDWQFGGVIRTQAQHDAFYQWVDRRRLIHVKDHMGRTFETYLTSFEPTDRTPTKSVSWRLRYVMKAQILRQL